MRKTIEVEVDLPAVEDVLDELAHDIFEINRINGFWEIDETDEVLTVPVKLALIHDEVSEALQVHRKRYECPQEACFGDSQYCEYDYEMMTPAQHADFGEELADIIIRTLDLAYGRNVPIGKLVQQKTEKNKSRPYKHNKKY